MTALKQGFQDQVKLLAELTNSKPNETRVRGIFKEEIQPLEREVNIIKKEVALINTKV